MALKILSTKRFGDLDLNHQNEQIEPLVLQVSPQKSAPHDNIYTHAGMIIPEAFDRENEEGGGREVASVTPLFCGCDYVVFQ
jgi:hypothetical protein